MENERGSCSGRKPNFCKTLSGDFEKELRIPQAFITHLSEESQSSQQAVLKGPSGNGWHVRLNRTADGMSIQDGWRTFSKDHSLHKTDFLVFTYDAYMHFSLRIFDTSACEREDAFAVIPSQEPTFCEARKKCGVPSQHLPVQTTKYKSELQNPHLYGRLNSSQGELPSSSNLERRMKTAKREATAAAKSFSSGCHYFISPMIHSSLNKPFNLTIPVGFARAHLPGNDRDLELWNEEGKMWRVHCYVRPSQYSICGGWRAFVHDNHLKQGDYCVFELVDKDELVLNVHFFRC